APRTLVPFSSLLACGLRYAHSSPTRRSSDLVSFAVRFDFQRLHGRFRTVGVQMDGDGVRALAVLVVMVVPGLGALQVDALGFIRSEEHTSELQSRFDLVCRLLLDKKNTQPRR